MGCDLKTKKWRLVASVRDGKGSISRIVDDAMTVSEERYDSLWKLEPFTTKLEAKPEPGWEFSHWLVCSMRCQEVTDNPIEVEFPPSDTRLNVVSVRAYFVETQKVFDPWQYDQDDDGQISSDEALKAISDYFAGDIQKGEALQVLQLYFYTASEG